MNESSSGLVAAQTAQADEERTKRAFIGFLSSALGVDQTYTNDDAFAQNAPGQYIIANPDGSYSQVGRSVSNLNSSTAQVAGFAVTPGLLIIGAVLAFVAIRALK